MLRKVGVFAAGVLVGVAVLLGWQQMTAFSPEAECAMYQDEIDRGEAEGSESLYATLMEDCPDESRR